jgi:hypothetical protein
MPGLVPGIHAFFPLSFGKQSVDGRDKPRHDERLLVRPFLNDHG